ncbi:MAG: DUF362 domain-containing protein [Candidatus Aminicenantes bacterium]|nr:DUF362 domain-containing protein [Candidatus Aminicenantes bacterium]
MEHKINRREFFKKSTKIGVAALGSSLLPGVVKGSSSLYGQEKVDIAVTMGGDYYDNTVNAVELLGGMKNFVPSGAKVAILPNVQRWHPGTFTKAEIVRAVVRMCMEAGAKEVNCLSWLEMNNWEATKLDVMLKEEGANLKLIAGEEANFKPVKVPNGKSLKEAMILKEFYNNDVFINMPITKDHAGNKFTGTLKNHMGLNYRVSNRTFHKEGWQTVPSDIQFLDQCIADLNTVIKPTLNIVDATEFITTNGPMGPGKVIKPQKIVAGFDRIAIDSYCCTLWGLKAEDIFTIKAGYAHGLGQMDLSKVKIKEIKV